MTPMSFACEPSLPVPRKHVQLKRLLCQSEPFNASEFPFCHLIMVTELQLLKSWVAIFALSGNIEKSFIYESSTMSSSSVASVSAPPFAIFMVKIDHQLAVCYWSFSKSATWLSLARLYWLRYQVTIFHYNKGVNSTSSTCSQLP